jgi:hypothetical protein
MLAKTASIYVIPLSLVSIPMTTKVVGLILISLFRQNTEMEMIPSQELTQSLWI